MTGNPRDLNSVIRKTDFALTKAMEQLVHQFFILPVGVRTLSPAPNPCIHGPARYRYCPFFSGNPFHDPLDEKIVLGVFQCACDHFHIVKIHLQPGRHIGLVVWEEDNVLTVPTSALFQHTNAWQVFMINDDTVELRTLTLGQRGQEYAQMLEGLSEGDRIVLYPSDLIEEGVTVSY